MQRYRQTLEELIEVLSAVETSWMDDHSAAVVKLMASFPEKDVYECEDVGRLLDADFEAGKTAIRVILGKSKDEFTLAMRKALGGAGVTLFRKDRERYLSALEGLGLLTTLSRLVTTPVTWRDILTERMKYGRGSAIKGQKRGRSLEDTTEEIVTSVFEDVGFETRCRFVGANGQSTEKCDFAIPNKEDPSILIECKAYGATGSKQTDILGDVERVVAEKRLDTHLLLVADGESWVLRKNDLRRLVAWQNEGRIARIYTQTMASELEKDLRQLREDHSLGS